MDKVKQNNKKRLSKTGIILIAMGSVLVAAIIAIALVFGVFKVNFSKTVANVNETKIKESEIDVYVNFLKSQDPESISTETPEETNTLKTSILDSIIVLRLLEGYAEENDILVSEDEIQAQIDVISQTYGSEADFEDDMESKNITVDFLRNEINGQILRGLIFQEVTKDITVSDEQLEEYYEENKEKLFKIPERINVSHILVNLPKDEEGEVDEAVRSEALDKIKFIEEELKSGEDFAELATQYSDDEVSAENGGEIGFVSEGQLVPEFEDVAFDLEIGKLSEITETDYGYHIIKVTEKEEEYIQTFEEVKETIYSYIEYSEQMTVWEDFIYQLLENAQIEYVGDYKGSLLDIEEEVN